MTKIKACGIIDPKERRESFLRKKGPDLREKAKRKRKRVAKVRPAKRQSSVTPHVSVGETDNEMEDTRIYNYIDLIDLPYDDFFGMWYYELDSGKLDEAKLPPHYLAEPWCRRHPVPIIALIFFYKEQALKVKEKLQQSDKDKRVVSFNWLSSDIKKRTAPRIDSTEYLSLLPIEEGPPIDLNELPKYDETLNLTPRWVCYSAGVAVRGVRCLTLGGGIRDTRSNREHLAG